jgi:alpha-tubulin suppressor-like RCC1 family protein
MNSDITMAACGHSHTLFLTKEKKIVSAGKNQFGQLGVDNSFGEGKVFLAHNSIEKDILDNVVFIAAGDSHSLAIVEKK